MNKKTIEIIAIYIIIILICGRIYKTYSNSFHTYSITLFLVALLIGLVIGTIVNVIYFKFKNRN